MDSREDFIVELYNGLVQIMSTEMNPITFLEFRARMQSVSTENIRQQVLELRKILKVDTKK